MSHYDDIESEGVLNPEYFRQLEREEQQERARRMLATKDDPVNHPKHYTSPLTLLILEKIKEKPLEDILKFLYEQ